MAVRIDRLGDEAIIVGTLQQPFEVSADAPLLLQEVVLLRDGLDGVRRYFVVLDATGVTLSFSDVVVFLGELYAARRQRRQDLPASVAVVGSGALIEMAANAMGQQQYGEYPVHLFTSLDVALKAIRAELAAA